MIAHCLFEQSGTFKNEFKKLGYEAYDYDIQNEFGETDFVIDLFAEIKGGYEGKPSIFDNISKDDLILAFFPCTYFEDQALLGFRGDRSQMRNYTLEQKLKYSLQYHEELSNNYRAITQLSLLCIEKGLRLFIENPYSEQHYLTRYWSAKPKIIDKDRTLNGDRFRKPTQYYFINFEPKQNFIFEPIEYVETVQALQKMKGTSEISRKTARSMIHPQYANRFIRQYLIDEEGT